MTRLSNYPEKTFGKVFACYFRYCLVIRYKSAGGYRRPEICGMREEIFMDSEIKALITHFNFQPLPVEGTLFVSTYRSPESLPNGKPYGTGMIGMYCNEPKSISYFHKLTVDEMWHYYAGDPLRLILLYPDGSSRDVIMGSEPLNGHSIQFLIPAGVWQAGHTVDGGRYSLFGCTLAPGFTDDIFTGGSQTELLKLYPDRKADILKYGLTGGGTTLPEGFAS